MRRRLRDISKMWKLCAALVTGHAEFPSWWSRNAVNSGDSSGNCGSPPNFLLALNIHSGDWANNFKPKGFSSDRWFSDIFRIYWLGKYCLLHKRTLATQKDNTLWTEKSDETCHIRVRQFSPVRGDMIGKTAAVTTRLHLSVIETVMHEGLRTRTNFRGVPSPFQNREENKKARRNDISVPLNGARGVVLGAACC